MLVLSRLINEEVVIQVGDKLISVIVVDIRSEVKVRIGFKADSDVVIHRREIYDLIQQQNALQTDPNLEVQGTAHGEEKTSVQ